MAVAPGVQNSTESTSDDLSPTTLVMRYLQKQGISPNMKGYGAEVRKALEANARDPGVIPGLRSDTAATEADDQAAMAASRSRPGVGQPGTGGGSVAKQVEGDNNSPVDTRSGDQRETAPDTSKTTSASPDGNSYPNLGMQIAIPAAYLGAGAIAGQPSAARSPWPTAGDGAGPMPDPAAGVAPAPTAMVEPPPSLMEQAMQQAVPSTNGPSVGDSVPPMPDIGPIPQPRIPAGPGSAVLPPDLGAPPPQTIPSGPVTQTLPQNMPENAPRLPMPNRVGAQPTPADFYDPTWRTIKGPLARAILGHM